MRVFLNIYLTLFNIIIDFLRNPLSHEKTHQYTVELVYLHQLLH